MGCGASYPGEQGEAPLAKQSSGSSISGGVQTPVIPDSSMASTGKRTLLESRPSVDLRHGFLGVDSPALPKTVATLQKLVQTASMDDLLSAGSDRQYQHAEQLARQASQMQGVTIDEYTIQAIKEKLRSEWQPEYIPEEIRPPTVTPDTVSERATIVTTAMVLEQQHPVRKTKIICTMGPCCWSAEMLEKLIDAGMNIMRLNFSHGDHASHLDVLQRFRQVCSSKGVHCAALLDTKGPEIRTAMLRDHKSIQLEAGQSIIVQAVGDAYTTFEGYKTEEETRIGLSYAKLCQSVKKGNKILLADGSLSIEVVEILSDTELRGRVLNSKALGERKNGNLPGVKVDIPVLTAKDIDDLQSFGCKYNVDYIAASFVQSADDVRFIRRTLDEAGGQNIKIISKIENSEGLINFDEILAVTDGIMVARGDLGMEIPSEKVPVAQKMMITKCNIAGKPVVTATQMLESMITNPLPTRAEMTDVANAVYDGTDCVMLSGETANGQFPDIAVSTMAAIVANAETGVDYYSQYNFIRYWVTRGGTNPMSAMESVLSSAAKMAVALTEDSMPDLRVKVKMPLGTPIILVITGTGVASTLISKYRPPCPIVVASNNRATLLNCSSHFGQIPVEIPDLNVRAEELAKKVLVKLHNMGILDKPEGRVITAMGSHNGDADDNPMITVVKVGSAQSRKRAISVTSVNPNGVIRPGVRSLRSTHTNLELIMKPVSQHARMTKILCTMGPKCWSEEMLEKLLISGLDIMRMNFSHGDHKGHLEVLERFRKVTAKRSADLVSQYNLLSPPQWGTLLDTKGPEIRTAMLRDHKSIDLEAGQPIIVEAVGDAYTTFEGYKEEDETRIGLSYANLCSSVGPGDRILLADGTITITVEEVLNKRELRGRVMNSKSLGERKNGNLPGVKVDLPVLTDKDIDDLVNFGCKNKVDYVAASFVQSAADVRFIRKVLNENGGERIKIISKIENTEGVKNFDEILKETDGIMVARGDLGMEIPSAKVPLAQKMMITKCNMAGKFVVTATQMLESMITNPRPTRAEMTDVANAVLDGTDCVMLSGETANGDFAEAAVSTMAAICINAEEMIDVGKRYDFLRNHTPRPMAGAEAVASSAVMTALDIKARAIVVITTSGRAPALVSKYRPSVPVFVVTPDEQLIRHCRSVFGQIGVLMEHLDSSEQDVVAKVVQFARDSKLADIKDHDQLVIVTRKRKNTLLSYDDQRLVMRTAVVGEPGGAIDVPYTAYPGKKVVFYRSTKIALDTILDPEKYRYIVRKTKILCTMGPSCWSEEMLTKLLQAGMNVMRLNFSHGDHAGHFDVLQRFRKVCQDTGIMAASLLDTKGPEIRTAMLRDHKPISLEAGQSIIVEAVGDAYTTFEGYKTAKETRIGLSYAKLCSSVKKGNKILLADGSISIEVEEILSDRELRGRVLNSKSLGERKNGNLPGVKVDIPVLTAKDIDDLQNFACKNDMDFVAASFVQSKADVLFIRKVLDEAGGQQIKIISKIENSEGLINYDEILEASDGIMVARGDLGMEIPAEKVPLAQKMMITKANIAGRFVICATQMLESMVSNPMPTRAEMTDVANAVFDGVDAVMLSGETANGAYPEIAVSTMARIARSAEVGVNYYQSFDYIRQYTPKPVGTVEAVVSTLSKNAVDISPGMIVAFSEGGKTARLLSKYRPCAPVLLVTSNEKLARYCQSLFSLYPMLLPKPLTSVEEITNVVALATQFGVAAGLCVAGKEVLVLTSSMVASGGELGKDGYEVLPEREVFVTVAPGQLDFKALGSLAPFSSAADPRYRHKTISLRSTVIDLPMVLSKSDTVRKTKIGATLGPNCWSKEQIVSMIEAGMDFARFNFSHGSTEQHVEVLQRLREVCKEKGRQVAVMMDLVGSDIRTSYLIDKATGQRIKSIKLEAGQEVLLEGSGDIHPQRFVGWQTAEETRIRVSLPDIAEVVQPGGILRMQDGVIALKVLESHHGVVRARVLNSCTLLEHKVINLVGVKLHLPRVTEQDLVCVQEFAIKYGVDFVAPAQVSSKADIEVLRQFLEDFGGVNIKIIAKIETENGLLNLDEIIGAADGIMVARGNLGTAITPEKVALAQGMTITKCNIAGKPVIVSRQMLESMVSNPRPTRAEMTDICNAVLDGADCIMLTNETAGGDFPVAAVQTAAAICQNAEQAMNYATLHSFIQDMSTKPFTTLESAASCAARAVQDADLHLLIVISEEGTAPALVSKFKASVPQVVITNSPAVAAMSKLSFGQFSMVVEELENQNVDELIANAVVYAKKQGLYTGGRVAVLHGRQYADADNQPVMRIV